MKRIVRCFLFLVILGSLVPVRSFASDEQQVEDTVPTVQIVQSVAETSSETIDPQPVIAEVPILPALPVDTSVQEDIPPLITPPPLVPSVPVQTAPLTIPPSGPIIVSALQVSAQALMAVELTNMASKPVDLSSWGIEAVYSDGVTDWSCKQNLAGYLLSKQQTTFVEKGVAVIRGSGAPDPYDAAFSCDMPSGVNATTAAVTAIDLWDHGTRVEHVQLEGVGEGVWVRKGTSLSYRSGTFMKDFAQNGAYLFMTMDLYFPPETTALQITEVYSNPLSCTSIDPVVLCHRYIKVHNPSNDDIDLGMYRLRAGSPTTAATSANTSTLTGIVRAGATAIVDQTVEGEPIYLAASDGSVWFQDEYGLRDYSSGVTPYSEADTMKHAGLSWAYDENESIWTWSLPSPDTAENNIRPPIQVASAVAVSSLKPCADNQYRSEETNRCRTIVTATAAAPCKVGQYRSEETNRCRSVTLAAATLKPCSDDQFRNPATGRCKKIASTEDLALADCGEGRERNPTTNRCRNVVSATVPQAAFAVEPVAEAGTSFVGWWALGGVGALGLGYAGWEWRREVGAMGRKARSFFTTHK